MILKFMISFLQNLTKDFRKDTRLEKKSNRGFSNDYLIRKEEYGMIP